MFGSEKGKEFNLQSPEDRVRDERNRIVYFEKKKRNMKQSSQTSQKRNSERCFFCYNVTIMCEYTTKTVKEEKNGTEYTAWNDLPKSILDI